VLLIRYNNYLIVVSYIFYYTKRKSRSHSYIVLFCNFILSKYFVLSCCLFLLYLSSSVNKLALVQFKLNEHNHPMLVNMILSNENIDSLEQWLNNVVKAAEENQDVTQSLCDGLKQIFRAIPHPNSNDEELKYLAIMIVDGALTLGNNPSAASDEFNSHNITLAVVAHMTSAMPIWNDYHTLAEKTGGAYMLETNAPAILTRVISSTINEEHTLHQAFQHIHPESVAVANDIDDRNEREQPSDADDDLVFDLDLSQ